MTTTRTAAAIVSLALSVLASGTAAADSLGEVRSVFEPGSLGAGKLGIRTGFSVADGTPGPGAEVFLGLGRVDVSVGASAMRVTIIDTETVAIASAAAQAHIVDWGSSRLGARVMVVDELTDSGRVISMSELRLTTGSNRRRLLAGGVVSVEHQPNDEWNTALIAHAGVELLTENVGVALLAVLIVPLDESGVLPLVSANLSFH